MYFEVTKEIGDYLITKDPIFSKLINQFGYIKIELHMNLFESIIYNIVGQMLSKKASDTIYNRLKELLKNNITAKEILKHNREEYRECGLSYSKADYLIEFAKEYDSGKYNFNSIKDLSDEKVISYLRQIKGVGLWTAEMLALFSLGRENIFSYDDVALRNGIMKSKGFKSLSKKRFVSLKKKYSPYCSYASLYFYRINDN